MELSAGQVDEMMIARLEKRIIELIAFGVFAVDGDQDEVDRQIENCRAQIVIFENRITERNDAKQC